MLEIFVDHCHIHLEPILKSYAAVGAKKVIRFCVTSLHEEIEKSSVCNDGTMLDMYKEKVV